MIANLAKTPSPRARLTRSRFWLAIAAQSAVVMGLVAADLLVFGDGTAPRDLTGLAAEAALGLATAAAATFGVVLAIRRLRDAGRSGWWALLGMVPLVGGLLLLIQAGRRDKA